jgi:hypothetical protein
MDSEGGDVIGEQGTEALDDAGCLEKRAAVHGVRLAWHLTRAFRARLLCPHSITPLFAIRSSAPDIATQHSGPLDRPEMAKKYAGYE